MDLAALVSPGATASRSLVFSEELTVGHWAEGRPPVPGKPLRIYLMEADGETRPGTAPAPGERA